MGYAERPRDEEKEKTSIFLICPVRNVPDEVKKLIRKYVDEKRAAGFRVYYPADDTPQVDPTGGIRICEDNRRAIENASEVHLWYDAASKGSHFDLGMAFALGKRIILANKDVGHVHAIPTAPFGFDVNKEIHIFLDNYQILEDYKRAGVINFRLDPFSNRSVFRLGMAFALRKPIRLVNLEQIPQTKEKSINNVARALDARGKHLEVTS
jgi:nucleoside 2-deoxyribosyltransferase